MPNQFKRVAYKQMQDFWQNYSSVIQNMPHSLSSITGNDIFLSTPLEGYDTIESSNSIIPLSQLAFIAVQGQDATKFLQGQFTCHFPETPDSKLLLGAHCSTKGKIQNFFRILYCSWLEEAGYLLIFHISTLEETTKRLNKYSLFSKVKIVNKTNDFAAFVMYGNEAEQLISKQLSVTNLSINDSTSIDTNHATVIRLRGDKPRYLCFAAQSNLPSLWNKCKEAFKENNSYFWDLLEIRAGIPTIYQTTVDQFFPHHLNLPTLNAVSFEKGCYLGQEVIARMQYRGKVNKHLHRALIEGCERLPQPGEEIVHIESETSTHPVGTVVSASYTRPENCELLIIIKDDYQNFENLFLKSEGAPKLHHLNLTYS